jgi:outer membrane protein assembly factor BamB
LRLALARGAREAMRAAAEVVDALALEVDGVDVAAGRAEGNLVAAMLSLGEGVLRVLADGSAAQVHFAEGGVELLVRRRAASALLTVVTLARPARVLARDVEVDLAELARAVQDAARALAVDLASLHPAAGAATRSLRRLADRLAAADAAPAQPRPSAALLAAPRIGRQRDVPACSFEIHDDELLATYAGQGADLGSLLAPGRVLIRIADAQLAASEPAHASRGESDGGPEDRLTSCGEPSTWGERAPLELPPGPAGRGPCQTTLSVEGTPFLVLRDLAAFAARLAEAAGRSEQCLGAELARPGHRATVRLEVDFAAGAVALGDGPFVSCPPLLLARTLLEGATDFCAVITARHPRQAENAWLSELRASAAEGLAHVRELLAGDLVAEGRAGVRVRRGPRPPRSPLGPGRMRRLRFRRAWEVEVGPPAGFGIARVGDLLLAAGAAAVAGLDACTGEPRWRRPGAMFAVCVGADIVVADATHLALLDARSGQERWRRPRSELPAPGLRAAVRLAGGALLLVTPGACVALHPTTGASRWSFTPPAALDLRAAALGPMALVGSDTGFLYGLDARSGAVAWRVRLPGPLATPPLPLAGACLALCSTDIGGSLLALDPASGRRRFELPLDVAPAAAPITFAGLIGIVGMVAGDAVVTAVDPEGRLAWADAPPLSPGPLVLAPLRSGVLAKTSTGTCIALDRQGETLWTHARSAGHPPPTNAPPVVLRGVALVGSEDLTALDAATGYPLGHARLAAPARLLADGELNAWGIDAEGLVTAVQLHAHLSVL